MAGLRRSAATGAVLVAAASLCALPGSALAGVQPGDPPELCDSELFADQIGGRGRDVLTAARRPERLWGLGAPDRLTGSATRASCLFGGGGADVLDLSTGGGLAWGEGGQDAIAGSPYADELDGGPGRDGIAAGDGNDHVVSEDGVAEIVDCGPGNDLAKADRADLLMSCEFAVTSGPSTPLLRARPRAARASAKVRIGFRIPEAAGAGAYRVVLLTGSRGKDCANGPLELTRLPVPGRRVRRGQQVRVGLRPPTAGWCKGQTKAAVVLHRACPKRARCLAEPPGEPIARVRFDSAPR